MKTQKLLTILSLSVFLCGSTAFADENVNSRGTVATNVVDASDIDTIRKKAEAGEAKAQGELARSYFNGTNGLPVDYEKAVFWARKAADQGDADGQNVLGICYDDGLGVAVDKKEAFRLIRLAAEQGLARAQCNLAFAYLRGNAVPADKKEAEKWLLKAAEQGATFAQIQLGKFFGDNDSEKAEAWFLKAADNTSDPLSAWAAYEISCIYGRRASDASKEKKENADELEATKQMWLFKAAEGGYPDAQSEWGYRLLENSNREGIDWVKKSAEQGNFRAQLMLGHVYAEGICVSQNPTEAVKWWTKASEHEWESFPSLWQAFDIATAQHNLAASYMLGFGVPVDEQKALDYIGESYKRALGPDRYSYAEDDNENTAGIRGYLFESKKLREGLRKADALWRERGFEWLREKSEAGDPHAQRMLGLHLLKGSYKYLCLPEVRVNKAEGIAWLRKSAEQGCPEGMYHLGWAYMSGDGVPQSEEKAVAWWQKSADAGGREAAVELKKFADWKKEQEERNNAFIKLRNAAEAGDADAQVTLGLCYERGIGVPENKPEAVKWYRKAAEQGDLDGQCHLARCYCGGIGVPADLNEAYRLWLDAANRGHAHAQYEIGVCSRYGHGCEVDYEKAVEWYRKAAAQDHADAMSNLGLMYSLGLGVSKNMREAVRWWEKSAALGNVHAQALLGRAYFYGNGVEQNFEEAAKWFAKGAEQGEPDSQCHLGYLLMAGYGIPQNQALAIYWWTKAAEQGFAVAQRYLGIAYLEGYGVLIDTTEAEKWFEKAAAQGDEESKEFLRKIRNAEGRAKK